MAIARRFVLRTHVALKVRSMRWQMDCLSQRWSAAVCAMSCHCYIASTERSAVDVYTLQYIRSRSASTRPRCPWLSCHGGSVLTSKNVVFVLARRVVCCTWRHDILSVQCINGALSLKHARRQFSCYFKRSVNRHVGLAHLPH